MGDEDLRLENGRLKEQLHRIAKVCELHRKLGEDTEFEVREINRKLEELKKKMEAHIRHYDTVATRIADEGSEELRAELELCSAALENVKELLSKIQSL